MRRLLRWVAIARKKGPDLPSSKLGWELGILKHAHLDPSRTIMKKFRVHL